MTGKSDFEFTNFECTMSQRSLPVHSKARVFQAPG